MSSAFNIPAGLSAFDEAVAAELPCVSTLEYNSHEVCKWFAKNIRERLAAATPAVSRAEGLEPVDANGREARSAWDMAEYAAQDANRLPRMCKGKNCGTTDGRYHSADCHAEHEAATAPEAAVPSDGVREAAQALVNAWPTGYSRTTHDAMAALQTALAIAPAAPAEPVAFQYWTVGEFWRETSRLGYEARRGAGDKVRALYDRASAGEAQS